MNEAGAKQQVVENIRNHSNILVAVSANPSVDELSAALGLTILLNNYGKHATAVMSGKVPRAINFLKPDNTFEDKVDSLRDFVISLDKEKADHLRYKLVGDAVKIFITPYRTVIDQNDLEFSQGDYNVEFVIALGVKDQSHLDNAFAAHGRIFHDATVATVTVGNEASKLGSIDWRDETASSLSEMMVSLSEALKDDQPLINEQIATAFLTGIVSATDRFSNSLTTSRVMTMAAQLMGAGANQQLIASKLQEAHDIGPNIDKSEENKPAEHDKKPLETPKEKLESKPAEAKVAPREKPIHDREPAKEKESKETEKPKTEKPELKDDKKAHHDAPKKEESKKHDSDSAKHEKEDHKKKELTLPPVPAAGQHHNLENDHDKKAAAAQKELTELDPAPNMKLSMETSDKSTLPPVADVKVPQPPADIMPGFEPINDGIDLPPPPPPPPPMEEKLTDLPPPPPLDSSDMSDLPPAPDIPRKSESPRPPQSPDQFSLPSDK